MESKNQTLKSIRGKMDPKNLVTLWDTLEVSFWKSKEHEHVFAFIHSGLYHPVFL